MSAIPSCCLYTAAQALLSYYSQARSKGRGNNISQWFSGTSGAQERPTLLTLEELAEQTSR